jgi:phosphatidylglycerol---prolipoprotein diacylglyceryl transferase
MGRGDRESGVRCQPLVLPFVFAPPGSMFGISPWAICLVVGGWVGLHFADRRARFLGYRPDEFHAATTWIIGMGFVLGHVVDEVFYHPEDLAQPASLLHLFHGQSSCGGFLGAIVGGWLWQRVGVERVLWRIRVVWRDTPLPLLPFGDVLSATFPVIWVFSRLGCALVHDHPGRLAPSGSWFAIAWPTSPEDGVSHALGPLRFVYGSESRYDTGLLECIFTIVLALSLATTWRKRLPMGATSCALCLAYAPFRFALDFLRVRGVPEADARYASLTFAQWFCIVLLGIGATLAVRLRRGGLEPSDAAMASLLAGSR